MAYERIARALRETQDAPPMEDHSIRRASVALVFRDKDGPWPDLLMIKRAEFEGDPWSGHMAFPGGGVEAGENVVEAALRETREELALELGSARSLGALYPVVSPRIRRDHPGIHVQPLVFWLDEVPALRPNHEVAEVHWFGLERFLEDEGRATFPFRWKGTQLKLPCHRLDGRLIWGMSLSMIDDLVGRLRRLDP